MKKRFLTALALGCAAIATAGPAAAQLEIGISVRFEPPALPVYEQPPIPGPDYIWTPGFWAWDDDIGDYFWVPGTWVRAPQPGLLWTPAWWGWDAGVFIFHPGYWAPHVGFYGGIAYGFGYTGQGYQGGYWNGGHVYYNRTVNNITNVNITNVYNQTVVRNNITRVSYNGGPNGIAARPTQAEQAVVREQRVAATPMQRQQASVARADPHAFVRANGGHPPRPAAAPPGMRPGPAAQPVPGNRPPANGMMPPRAEQQRNVAPFDQRANPGGEMRPEMQQREAPRPDQRMEQRMAPPPAPRPDAHMAPPPMARPAPQPQPHAAPPPRPRPAPQHPPKPRPRPEEPHDNR